ncbi:hypothetical protein PVAP13_1KG050277 [Panicum virgatum]|uniref:Uncharacterized protein n=1 Tax=Panicum virgatum TaxID=38727 RepID=A0A8T0XH25_PANVG|nr:hypothetical protein PVAP13_1KG050277 [Panicum virgatum]
MNAACCFHDSPMYQQVRERESISIINAPRSCRRLHQFPALGAAACPGTPSMASRRPEPAPTDGSLHGYEERVWLLSLMHTRAQFFQELKGS